MNIADWIILGLVVVALAAAISAIFHGKVKCSGNCSHCCSSCKKTK